MRRSLVLFTALLALASSGTGCLSIASSGGGSAEGWNSFDGGCDGQGTYAWLDGTRYVGECKAGLSHGQGTWTGADGAKYVGEYWDDERHGQGTWTGADGAKYVGEYRDHERHGQGTYTWADGSKYVGGFKAGLSDGQGTWTSANGDLTYVGEFKDDMPNGQGTYTWADGSKYVGEIQDSNQHGQGTWTGADGAKYVGEYRDDKQHGQGTYTWADGDKYVGEWKDYKKHGQGTSTYTDGSTYVGEFKAGLSHGQGTWTGADGATYVGEYKDGKMHGQGTYYYADGKITNDTYEDGKLLTESTVAFHQAWFVPKQFENHRANAANDSDARKHKEEIARLKREQEQHLAALEARLATQSSAPYSAPNIGTIGKGPRTALVIGNSGYTSSPLTNPVNDAVDMAKALRRLGFDVDLLTDVSKRKMGTAISRFGKTLKKGGVGLFFYAGHGMQVDGTNYLIPIGADPSGEEDLEYDAIDAGRVLAKMDAAGNELNIVMMDACRNNPFARSWRSGSRGLARIDAPTGSIVVYATAPGSIAADGEGRNGIFTKHLLRAIQQPNVPLLKAIRMTRIGVMGDTNNGQVPWVSEATTKEFFFAGQTR